MNNETLIAVCDGCGKHVTLASGMVARAAFESPSRFGAMVVAAGWSWSWSWHKAYCPACRTVDKAALPKVGVEAAEWLGHTIFGGKARKSGRK